MNSASLLFVLFNLTRLAVAIIMGHASMGQAADSLNTNSLLGILIVADVKLAAQVLGSEKGKKQGICVDAAHEDADNLAVVVALDALFGGRQWELLAETSFDGGRCRGDQVTELVGSTDDKGAECTGG